MPNAITKAVRHESAWVFSCLLVAAFSNTVFGEQIVLKNGTSLTGELLFHDERGIEVRLASGQIVRYTPSEIQSVQAVPSPIFVQATSAFDRREYEAAIALARPLLDQEKRPWAKRNIDSLLMAALHRTGALDEAARIFFATLRERSDIEFLAKIPVVWTEDDPVSASSLAQARTWLTDERPLARLLAASWLLRSPQYEEARNVLDELQTLDSKVGPIARAQLWRTMTGPATEEEQARMETSVAKIPLPLRAGPQYLWARSLDRSGLAEQAALAYLWTAYVYDPGSELAADSLLRAAVASRQAGHPEESRRLLREVIEKYPGSNWAARAQNELSEKPEQGKPHGS